MITNPDPPRRPPVLVSDIKERVARYYRIPAREMESARRARMIARPRQVAMYLAKELTIRSLPELGRLFGNRDHTTILHGIRAVEQRRKIDAELDAEVAELERQLCPDRAEVEPGQTVLPFMGEP